MLEDPWPPVTMTEVRVHLVLLCAIAATGTAAGVALAQPQIPATFYGSVTVDGAPATAGTDVRAFVNGLDCTQAGPGQRPVFIDGEIAAYVLYVVHETQREGCAREGSNITFTIGDRPAMQSAVWKAGPIRLDLSAGSASPIPLPTSTSAPAAAIETPAPDGGTPAGTPTLPSGTEGATAATGTLATHDAPLDSTPLPPGTSPAGNEDSDEPSILPVLGIILVVLAVGAGTAGYMLSRKHSQQGGPDSTLEP